jgi:ribosomal protein L40E
MADVIQDAQREFWRSPTVVESVGEIPLPSAAPVMADACSECGAEFMIHARFCHTCGRRRPLRAKAEVDSPVIGGVWTRNLTWFGMAADSVTAAWRKISFPDWLHYLHFHEIKRWVGLPTAALVAFIIGIGCVAGALGVSFFYKASNLAEFQAIQMWRIEWLLAATASFVAGILLKKPSGTSHD